MLWISDGLRSFNNLIKQKTWRGKQKEKPRSGRSKWHGNPIKVHQCFFSCYLLSPEPDRHPQVESQPSSGSHEHLRIHTPEFYYRFVSASLVLRLEIYLYPLTRSSRVDGAQSKWKYCCFRYSLSRKARWDR